MSGYFIPLCHPVMTDDIGDGHGFATDQTDQTYSKVTMTYPREMKASPKRMGS